VVAPPSSSWIEESELLLSFFEVTFGSAEEDREAREERELSSASLLLVALFFAVSLSAAGWKERTSASSASEFRGRGREIYVFCCWFFVQGLFLAKQMFVFTLCFITKHFVYYK
jgi:hypothetical protein